MSIALGETVMRPVRRTRRVIYLRHRLRGLAEGLGVDQKFVPSDQRGVDRVHAFRVLAYSEVQQFIEDMAGRVVETTADLSKRGTLTSAGHHLLVHGAVMPLANKRQYLNARYAPYATRDALHAFVQDPKLLLDALNRHRGAIKQNNGVKTGNVRGLFLPLGCREDFFAAGLLQKLDNFGEVRGSVAHGSGVWDIGTTQPPTGSTEWTLLNQILPGLDLLDRYIPRLLVPVS